MNLARILTLSCVALSTLAVPVFASVTVDNPANDTEVGSSFHLSASAAVCASGDVVAMGYSFDSSSDTTIIRNQSIDTTVSTSPGTHTLHVKAWSPNGGACVRDVTITVKPGAAPTAAAASDPASSSAGTVPSYADTVSNIQALNNWQGTHDTGGPGSSAGYTSTTNSPSMYGNSREFVSTFRNGGDERFSSVFSDNVDATNIFYDGWVYLTSSSSMLGNLEFDINQVMADGHTALIGFQCDGYTGQWAYNVNQGSTSSPRPHWQSKGGTTCNPRAWAQNKWHHVQASISRDGTGHVTYHSIWLDGVETKLNVTAYCGAALGWAPVVNTQFQIDGLGSSGHVTAYLDDLTVSMW